MTAAAAKSEERHSRSCKRGNELKVSSVKGVLDARIQQA